ncbi:Protein of unknown function [Lactobacillus delbrueckii subsp. lactis]|nr:Putative uncharacterized protein [Lactobacillus delbrueckii subsp. lactis]CDR81248.1 Protein of unknown function [Lactobacillus delbrueckii subsp. lactis]
MVSVQFILAIGGSKISKKYTRPS